LYTGVSMLTKGGDAVFMPKIKVLRFADQEDPVDK
jgi:hypothetical protein